MWLTLFNLVLQLALGLLRQVERKQQLEAARVEAAFEFLRKADEMVNDVDAIVAGVRHEPDDILHDSANRDRPAKGNGSSDSKGSV